MKGTRSITNVIPTSHIYSLVAKSFHAYTVFLDMLGALSPSRSKASQGLASLSDR